MSLTDFFELPFLKNLYNVSDVILSLNCEVYSVNQLEKFYLQLDQQRFIAEDALRATCASLYMCKSKIKSFIENCQAKKNVIDASKISVSVPHEETQYE
jgi:hypothetical protein